MAAAVISNTPWLNKAISLLGIHEAPGEADNPVIIGWAAACGGNIKRSYLHDSTAWCALFVNYCLISTGQQGDDSLMALDFARWGRRLQGPAVGAIVTKRRPSGGAGAGHVAIVGGRDGQGRLVCVGGNTSDEVKQQTFALDEVYSYSWPAGYPEPASTDFDDLPLVDKLVQSAPVNAPTTTATPPKRAASGASAAIASGISQRAFDFIVAKEVTDQAAYEHGYHRPTWPGASSGVTVGIGYDLGQTSAEQIVHDWSPHLPDAMVETMAECSGVTGQAAQGLAAQVRSSIDVSWLAALAVFRDVSMPRWVEIVRKALPNTNKLSPDCLGALVSLTYNRGASFSKAGDRYAEMRAIKQDMADMNLAGIPGEIRSMKRLWPDLRGLQTRRDGEADMFEQGLAASAAPPVSSETIAQGSAAGGIAVSMAAVTWLGDNPFVIGLMLVGLYAGIKALVGLRRKGANMATTSNEGTARVPVVSGWRMLFQSKINWASAVGFAMNAITAYTGYKFNLTADQIVKVLVALNGAQGTATVILRQFFTKSVTPSAVGK